MKIQKVSINGVVGSVSNSSISVVDHSFAFGVGVFETFRVSAGEVFLLKEHFARLLGSLDYLSIKKPNEELLINYLNELFSHFKPEDDLFVRLMVTAGNADFKLSSQVYDKPNIVIYAGTISAYKPTAKPAVILDTAKRELPEYFEITKKRLKTPDYLTASVAQNELNSFKTKNNMKEHIEGILLSSEGYVAEALTSNIFWVKHGKIFTSPLSLGILPGVIREFIVKNNKVEEKLITSKELEQADEIFLTNSVNYLSPLNQLNKTKFPGTSGEKFIDLNESIIVT